MTEADILKLKFKSLNSLGPVKMYIGISVFLAISTDIRFSKNILNRLEQVCKPSLGLA